MPLSSQKPMELKKVPKSEEESARIQDILRENMWVDGSVDGSEGKIPVILRQDKSSLYLHP